MTRLTLQNALLAFDEPGIIISVIYNILVSVYLFLLQNYCKCTYRQSDYCNYLYIVLHMVISSGEKNKKILHVLTK